MNQDYYNYACRHLELLSNIMQQLDSLNTNMYNIYERPHVTSRERETRRTFDSSLNNNRNSSRSNSSRSNSSRSNSSSSSMNNSSSTNAQLWNRMRGSRPYSSYRPSPIARPSRLQQPIPTTPTVPITRNISTTGNSDLSTLANNILNTLFLEPVAVFPTPEQIENATSVIEYSDLPEDSRQCPITLEHFTETTPLLRIDQCGHIFTRSGILRWFHNHVNCPVCRHDIRSIETNTNSSNTSNSNNSSNSRTNNTNNTNSRTNNTNNTNSMNDNASLNTTLQFDFILQPNVTNSSDSLENITYLPNQLYTYYSNSNIIPDNTNNTDNIDNTDTVDTHDNIDNAYNSDINQIV